MPGEAGHCQPEESKPTTQLFAAALFMILTEACQREANIRVFSGFFPAKEHTRPGAGRF